MFWTILALSPSLSSNIVYLGISFVVARYAGTVPNLQPVTPAVVDEWLETKHLGEFYLNFGHSPVNTSVPTNTIESLSLVATNYFTHFHTPKVPT